MDITTNKNGNQKNIPILYDNKSNIELNRHQKSVLNLEPKYILDEKIDLKDAIPHIERALTYIPEAERNKVRNKIQEEFEKIETCNKDNEDIKVLKKLKNNKDIACIHIDKTDKMVILNKQDCIEMMENTFKKMQIEIKNKDPKMKIQNKTVNLMKEGKWPENIIPVNHNRPPNIPRAPNILLLCAQEHLKKSFIYLFILM